MDAFIIFKGIFRNKVQDFMDRYEAIKWDVLDWDSNRKCIGNNWHSKSINKIKHAKCIVYLYGDEKESENIRWEISKALKMDKKIFVAPVTEHGGQTLHEDYFNDARILDFSGIARQEDDVFFSKDSVIRLECQDELVESIGDYLNRDYKVFNDISNVEVPVLKEISSSDGSKGSDKDICYANICIEQYKLFLETSESLLDRRQNVNTFYISVNSALVALFTILLAFDMQPIYRFIIGALFAFLGIILSVSWSRLIQSYGDLNRSKMAILQTIEKKLPLSLFDPEWSALMDTLNTRKYVSFTDSEKIVPKLFMGVYAILFIVMSCLAFF